MRSLGCTQYDATNDKYSVIPSLNPLLDHGADGRGPTARWQMFGVTKVDTQDPDQFATAGFAALLAKELGGFVIELHSIGNRPVVDAGASVFSVPQRLVVWTRKNDDGSETAITFNPGNVAAKMARDWENWNQRSGDIAGIIGMPYHAGLGESIFDAAVSAGLIAPKG